jgi:hypothetical protein
VVELGGKWPGKAAPFISALLGGMESRARQSGGLIRIAVLLDRHGQRIDCAAPKVTTTGTPAPAVTVAGTVALSEFNPGGNRGRRPRVCGLASDRPWKIRGDSRACGNKRYPPGT